MNTNQQPIYAIMGRKPMIVLSCSYSWSHMNVGRVKGAVVETSLERATEIIGPSALRVVPTAWPKGDVNFHYVPHPSFEAIDAVGAMDYVDIEDGGKCPLHSIIVRLYHMNAI
jgi:hypothetical protein